MTDVEARYSARSGVEPVDLEWFVDATLRHATIMFRIKRRQVLFGEAEMPENPDEAIPDAASLAAMMDGTYWAEL